MKLIDIYNDYKSKYPDVVIFIKSGKFYLTFDNDALISGLICGYKRVNNKLGFPEQSLDKVINLFKEKNINIIIGDKQYFNSCNNYYLWLKRANDDLMVGNMANTLLQVIKEKITSDFNNYEKIRNFLNEL